MNGMVDIFKQSCRDFGIYCWLSNDTHDTYLCLLASNPFILLSKRHIIALS